MNQVQLNCSESVLKSCTQSYDCRIHLYSFSTSKRAHNNCGNQCGQQLHRLQPKHGEAAIWRMYLSPKGCSLCKANRICSFYFWVVLQKKQGWMWILRKITQNASFELRVLSPKPSYIHWLWSRPMITQRAIFILCMVTRETKIKKNWFQDLENIECGGPWQNSIGREFHRWGPAGENTLFLTLTTCSSDSGGVWRKPSTDNQRRSANICRARWSFRYPGPRLYTTLQVITSSLNWAWKTNGSHSSTLKIGVAWWKHDSPVGMQVEEFRTSCNFQTVFKATPHRVCYYSRTMRWPGQNPSYAQRVSVSMPTETGNK